MTVWFSSVTTSRSVRATRRIASRSSGLIVGTCSTATSTWSASSRAAACSARIVIRPGGDEHDVAAGAQLGGLAELEPVAVLVEHRGHLPAQQAQVGRPGVVGELRDGLLDVDRVAGVDDRQVRAAAQDRQVLGGLVAGPVAGGQAGQRADDVDVEVGLGDVEAEEVVGPPGREDRVGGREGHQPDLGQAGCGAEHRLLGHAHLEEPLRVGVAEDVHVGVLGQVRRQPDDLRALLRRAWPARARTGRWRSSGRGRRTRRSSPRW